MTRVDTYYRSYRRLDSVRVYWTTIWRKHSNCLYTDKRRNVFWLKEEVTDCKRRIFLSTLIKSRTKFSCSRILGFTRDKFHHYTQESETSVSGKAKCFLAIGKDKKIRLFGVTFLFKQTNYVRRVCHKLIRLEYLIKFKFPSSKQADVIQTASRRQEREREREPRIRSKLSHVDQHIWLSLKKEA